MITLAVASLWCDRYRHLIRVGGVKEVDGAMPDFVSLINAMVAALSERVFATVELSLFGMRTDIQGIVLWLAVPMVLFTVYLGFPQLRALGLALRIVRGHFHDPDAPGEISQFKALATAVSGTVGLGNIAGVAVAVGTGGPGAVFWMWVIGLFAMALKCAEVTLGLKYRTIHPDGTVSGGPFYTLTRGLAGKGLPRTGKFLGFMYAILMLGGCLSLFQINQSYAQIQGVTGIDAGWAYGIVFALMVAAVVLGSIRWIATVTGVLVPLMCLLYISGCLIILTVNASAIPDAFALILHEAFAPASIWGGALGAFVVGMRRAVYSCEAGLGTAVMAHAQAKTKHPASEGLVALLEPFLDTVIICTLSGLTLVVAGVWSQDLEGVAMTSAAFASVSTWFPIVLAVAVFLFGFSTVVANGFYGVQAWQFLVGQGRKRTLAFKIGFCSILPLGAVLDVTTIVDFVDSVYFLMAIPNILGLYLLAPELKAELNGYLAKVKSGEIKPNS
jgi:alanine or glycine:cation symporter, AGCS family